MELQIRVATTSEKDIDSVYKLHIYPDVNFNLTIVPSYISFICWIIWATWEESIHLKVIYENPFLIRTEASLNFQVQVMTLLYLLVEGNSGLGGNYLISASYSLIKAICYSTKFCLDPTPVPLNGVGNYFSALSDNIASLLFMLKWTAPSVINFLPNGSVNLYNRYVKFNMPGISRVGWLNLD